MGGRRSNGEGTFVTRKDGRIQGSIRIAGHRVYVYGENRQEAYNKLQAKIEEAKRGQSISPEKMTLAEYFEKFLKVRSADLKAGPQQTYAYTLRRMARSPSEKYKTLGDIPLQKFSLDDVQAWVLWLKDRNLKPRTIRDYYARLHAAMAYAVETKLLAHNPCDGCKLPRVEKVKRPILTREQIAYLLDAFEGHWFRPIFVLFLATGLRAGELLALHWKDIDFEAEILHVRRNAVWITGKGYIENSPKTEASERDIVLQPFALDILQQQILDQERQRQFAGSRWKERGLVFTGDEGDYVRGRTFSYALTKALKKAEIQHITPHGLRRTTATQLLSMRINPKVVQGLLGHASIEMTLDLYGQTLPGEQEQAMAELNEAYWEQKPNTEISVILSRAKVVKMVVNSEVIIDGEWYELA